MKIPVNNPSDVIAEYRALLERATLHSQGVISPDITAVLEAFPRLVDVAAAAIAFECPICRIWPEDERADCPHCAPLRAAISKLTGGKAT